MHGRLSILLVEDSYTQALRVQLWLQRAGYDVYIASDGAEGWQQACQETPDLILLDVNLPTLDGFQVLTRLKFGRSTTNIPVIMLARCSYIGTIERALSLGAVAYVCKDDCFEHENGAGYLFAMVNKFLPATTVMTA